MNPQPPLLQRLLGALIFVALLVLIGAHLQREWPIAPRGWVVGLVLAGVTAGVGIPVARYLDRWARESR